ncbi:MAG: archease [Planctomycetaceae bacterium]
MHETFDHTADVGLRITAATLDELFAEAGRGFLSLLVDNPEAVRPERSFELEIHGERRDDLLFDWLGELLHHFESERLLPCEFDVEVSQTGLKATIQGEPMDASRHRMASEVKAITYHQLRVVQTDGGWEAAVIVDI